MQCFLSSRGLRFSIVATTDNCNVTAICQLCLCLRGHELAHASKFTSGQKLQLQHQ